MILNLQKRKFIHLLLFISILIIQIWVFKIWYDQKKIQNNFSKSVQNILTPNQALLYTNLATKSYFDAENNFNSYLQYHNGKSLKEYQKSIQTMSIYLDSLNQLANKSVPFFEIVKNKKNKENQVLKLRNQLDSLILLNTITLSQKTITALSPKKYDYTKILSSISYDTIKSSTQAKKKGMFGRIGNALSGKTDVNKENTHSKIKMIFNEVEKTGTFEEQIKNIFLFSERHYTNEFNRIRSVYTNLKRKDQQLLELNKLILNKSQGILIFYSNTTQELLKKQNTNATIAYNLDLNDKKNTILYLLSAILIITFFLLLYTIYAYRNETILNKAKSQAESNLTLKNQLIGMLSHEMRAPLNIISNFSSKLKTKNKDTGLNSIINSLHFTSNSLQITVNQILDFFKNENKKMLLYNSKVNLKKEIPLILASLSSLSEVKKIKLISNLESSLDNEVWADKVKIHQLFYNLIGNAIKFTKEGTITINATLIEIENKFKLDVTITDTGFGIPKEDIKNIFDEFYQSKAHTDQLTFGAGLGLSLCKKIIELFDGKIGVKSELHKGTEISFHLILDKFILGQETNKMKLISDFKNIDIKIAVVDDDPFTLAILKKLITNVHFSIVTFDTINAIKRYLETEIVDLIISDIHVFDQSGIDFTEEIKNTKNKNSGCPIIIISGDTFINSSDFKTNHADETLIKPINKDELYLKILNVLSPKYKLK
jgi:signal transduction histidine kinase/CheY-like chemotaxis protein